MERKGLIGKENRSIRVSDNLLYTALSSSYLDGDNQMKTSRLKQQSRQAQNGKIYFNKEINRGEN